MDLSAAWSAVHGHFASGDGYPFIACGVEPRETEGVLAVDVDMLAVREPPAALVVARAVCVRDVPVPVHGRELHVVLVLESITRVAPKPAHFQHIPVVAASDEEVFVFRVPTAAVDIRHVYSHG